MAINAMPKRKAITRTGLFVVFADTSAPKSLKRPPNKAKNNRMAPKTKKAMSRLAGIYTLRIYGIFGFENIG